MGTPNTSGPILHAGMQTTSVILDAYNVELRATDGFVGDRASKRAFNAILDDWRERLQKVSGDPFGDGPTEEITKKQLDRMLVGDNLEAAAVVHGVVEDYARELATVVRRFLRLKAWQDTQRIAVGGGLRNSRVGQLAIARAFVLLEADGISVPLTPIHYHPDEAGLVGCAHLAPGWMFKGHDSMIAVDVGGTNIRAGIVELNLKKHPDLSGARVVASEHWRHRDEFPTREEAVERLGKMLAILIDLAVTERRRPAPFIGIGCPGLIREDGSITKGGQNLPGNWESKRFHLPTKVAELVPTIASNETVVVMHNDAVVQGLSETPFMRDVEHWGILTIGTGLGNARFSNREGTSGDTSNRLRGKQDGAMPEETEKEAAKSEKHRPSVHGKLARSAPPV